MGVLGRHQTEGVKVVVAATPGVLESARPNQVSYGCQQKHPKCSRAFWGRCLRIFRRMRCVFRKPHWSFTGQDSRFVIGKKAIVENKLITYATILDPPNISIVNFFWGVKQDTLIRLNPNHTGSGLVEISGISSTAWRVHTSWKGDHANV